MQNFDTKVQNTFTLKYSEEYSVVDNIWSKKYFLVGHILHPFRTRQRDIKNTKIFYREKKGPDAVFKL